jgi:hypothetical protein
VPIVQHQRTAGLRHTYTIEAHRTGAYSIRLGDKVLRTWHDPLVVIGMSRPSKKREDQAVQLAIGDIEMLRGMTEE